MPRVTAYALERPPPPLVPDCEAAEARIDQDCESDRAAASGVIDARSTAAEEESNPLLRLPPWLLLRLRPARPPTPSLPLLLSPARAGERKPEDDWREADATEAELTPTKATEDMVRARCGVERDAAEAAPFVV